MIVVGLAVAIQFYPVERTNPPVRAEIQAPEKIRALLRSACYDCHSNETRWPWYSRVAPISWYLAHHVKGARGEFNFSEWDSISPEDTRELLEEMWEKVEKGEMPLPAYRVLHPESRLGDVQRVLFERWALAGTPEEETE